MGRPVAWPVHLPSALCSPVLFIQFILPLELPALHHTVVPQHQTSGDLLMELCGQVLEK